MGRARDSTLAPMELPDDDLDDLKRLDRLQPPEEELLPDEEELED